MAFPKLLFVLFLATIAFGSLQAQETERDSLAPDTLRGVTTLNGLAMPYTVLHRLDTSKNKAEAEPVPFVIFLHGAGERGTDNKAQLTVALPAFIASMQQAGIEHYIIYVPQCPKALRWVESDWTLPAHTMAPTPGAALATALHGLDSIPFREKIDFKRVYLTGISMGGFGVWELLQRYPKRFAGAIPICGGGDLAYVKRLLEVPIWAFHGMDDKLVKPSRTSDMTNAIAIAGGNVAHFTPLEKQGHLCWNKAYSYWQVTEWLFKQRLK